MLRELSQHNMSELGRLKVDNNKIREDLDFKTKKLNVKDMKEELYSVLKNRDDFKFLETAISDLSNMLVSKQSKDLNHQEKQILNALFGDSTVLHTMRVQLNRSHSCNKILAELITKVIIASNSLSLAIESLFA